VSNNGMKKNALIGAAWFVLGSEWWWVVYWNGMEHTWKKEFTGEIENTHTLSAWKPEWKRHFVCCRTRKLLKTMRWTAQKGLKFHLPS